MSYSHHFIKKVLKLKSEGISYKKLSEKFDISILSILRWKKDGLPIGKRNRSNNWLDLERLKKDVELYPNAYHYERAERLGVSSNCISHNLKKLGVTYKTSKNQRRTATIISKKGWCHHLAFNSKFMSIYK